MTGYHRLTKWRRQTMTRFQKNKNTKFIGNSQLHHSRKTFKKYCKLCIKKNIKNRKRKKGVTKRGPIAHWCHNNCQVDPKLKANAVNYDFMAENFWKANKFGCRACQETQKGIRLAWEVAKWFQMVRRGTLKCGKLLKYTVRNKLRKEIFKS